MVGDANLPIERVVAEPGADARGPCTAPRGGSGPRRSGDRAAIRATQPGDARFVAMRYRSTNSRVGLWGRAGLQRARRAPPSRVGAVDAIRAMTCRGAVTADEATTPGGGAPLVRAAELCPRAPGPTARRLLPATGRPLRLPSAPGGAGRARGQRRPTPRRSGQGAPGHGARTARNIAAAPRAGFREAEHDGGRTGSRPIFRSAETPRRTGHRHVHRPQRRRPSKSPGGCRGHSDERPWCWVASWNQGRSRGRVGGRHRRALSWAPAGRPRAPRFRAAPRGASSTPRPWAGARCRWRAPRRGRPGCRAASWWPGRCSPGRHDPDRERLAGGGVEHRAAGKIGRLHVGGRHAALQDGGRLGTDRVRQQRVEQAAPGAPRRRGTASSAWCNAENRSAFPVTVRRSPRSRAVAGRAGPAERRAVRTVVTDPPSGAVVHPARRRLR